MLDAKILSETLSVAPQIAVEDIPAIAAAGYKSIVCNRPDGESDDQPEMAAVRDAALASGLEFHYLPVINGQMNAEHISRFGQLLEASPAPILAYCRSGTRCTILWAMSQTGKQSASTLIDTAAKAGYDLSSLASRL